MVTNQHPHTPRRRPRVGDRATADPAAPPSGDGSLPHHNPYDQTPGHPDARGTLPMAHYLTDPAIEDEIQALAAEALPMTEDQRARLARMLRLNRRRPNDRAA
jgi:hypothetical protein